MRFLLGVIVGALATLCVATIFDRPTRALVAQGTSWAENGSSVWNRFFLATGEAVFPTAEGANALPVAVPFQVQDQQVSAQAPAAPSSSPGPGAGGDAEPVASDIVEAAVPDLAPAMEPLRELVSPDPVATHEQLEPPRHGMEAVWVPFRSQMSARGFAARLTQETQHPFAVTRNGPGRYQVNFAYANEAQREQLTQRILAVTGQVAP